ncbi:MAG: SDR family oxidoreductase [Pseudomonadota bacterium]
MSAAQRVVVTAGGAGIGAGIARAFAADGARVALCDLDGDAAQAVAGEIGGFGRGADVTDEDRMTAFLDAAGAWLGGVDVVCANAGIGGPAGRIDTLSLAQWRATLAGNLDGAFLTCRWAAERMAAAGSGCILLTASTAGLHGYPFRAPYATAKWGVIGLMKTLAMELGPTGVRVNALCPGAVEGARMERVLAREAPARGTSVEAVRDTYVRGVSLRSWVSAEDVAAAALVLASDAGAKISGEALAVDGHTETLGT